MARHEVGTRSPNIDRFLKAAKEAGIDLSQPVNEGALFAAYSEGRLPDPAAITSHVDELDGGEAPMRVPDALA